MYTYLICLLKSITSLRFFVHLDYYHSSTNTSRPTAIPYAPKFVSLFLFLIHQNQFVPQMLFHKWSSTGVWLAYPVLHSKKELSFQQLTPANSTKVSIGISCAFPISVLGFDLASFSQVLLMLSQLL